MRFGIARRALVILAAAAPGASWSAPTLLVRQNVIGVWRECVYMGGPRIGSGDPRVAIGTPSELTVLIGRGEPCPATYPEPRRARRPAPADSTWPSTPPTPSGNTMSSTGN